MQSKYRPVALKLPFGDFRSFGLILVGACLPQTLLRCLPAADSPWGVK